ncbi:GH116 family glycosyl hydrolase [Roseivirga echinicomitans]|uniref:Glycosyl-hydrolase family 116 catalytic region domain-containing protein n=1 Tax=Roseivirga echinicomitans TaxID=296218 RepID=A0A150X1W6_9BACT|nr:GH116 family glycosyl hydrolase [Roseivirga echinicomitans]KYG72698.1 hypothetical protein AWN68_08300 [Roseivirga echinicomitans]
MIRTVVFILLCLTTFTAFAQFPAYNDKLDETDGLPIANFAIAANISESGTLFNGIAANPGKLGQWLEYRGKAELSISYKNESFPLTSFEEIDNQRQFPISQISYENHKELPINMSLKSWAPAKLNDHFTTALPVVQTEITITNRTNKGQKITLSWELDSIFSKELKPTENGVYSPYISLMADVSSSFSQGSVNYAIELKAKESRTIRFAIATYDSLWLTAQKFKSANETSKFALANWSQLYQATLAFDTALPLTDDPELNDILRWYTVPAMILTKCTVNDEILTMGYRELNQRDSYWTSWLHLTMFKDAEKQMLLETIDAIKPNGKVPTTILPKIERLDDLDINAFFILRFFRYTEFHKDNNFNEKHWQSVKAAMDWLISRDQDKDGLPEQVSFWGDWKDVKGVAGRKYSPFSSLLYLSALKYCKTYAEKAEDQSAISIYNKAYDKAFELVNKPFEEGGLWADGFYQQQWNDNRSDGKILQDQAIGVFYDVVSPERANAIFETLNANNRTPYGIAETFPYYDSSYGYEPGEYHNGAVWPWLSFMDIWSRLKVGRKDEAIQLIKDIAKADLYTSGDYMPNEHINSLTGENLGFYIQGWNAALFGVFYFELKSK